MNIANVLFRSCAWQQFRDNVRTGMAFRPAAPCHQSLFIVEKEAAEGAAMHAPPTLMCMQETVHQ
eukprot:3084638-Amphidinium_carterae.3